jgi:hypothetical protein
MAQSNPVPTGANNPFSRYVEKEAVEGLGRMLVPCVERRSNKSYQTVGLSEPRECIKLEQKQSATKTVS